MKQNGASSGGKLPILIDHLIRVMYSDGSYGKLTSQS